VPVIAPPRELNSLYLRNAAEWPALYDTVFAELGDTATIVNFGDQRNAGLVNATTFTGRRFNASGLAPTWTPSEAMSAWDTSYDLRVATNWQGICPVATFNATDEGISTPDAAYWTRAAAAFSCGAWVNVNTLSENSTIWGKWNDNATPTQEWVCQVVETLGLQLLIWDQTNGARLGWRASAVFPKNRWVFAVATHDGGTTAANIKLYVDATDTGDTNANTGAGFTGMVDSATLPRVGLHLTTAGATRFEFNGKMAGGPLGPFFAQVELTAAQVKNLFSIGRLAMGV